MHYELYNIDHSSFNCWFYHFKISTVWTKETLNPTSTFKQNFETFPDSGQAAMLNSEIIEYVKLFSS